MNQPYVEILLATYNGEQYLREQIDSILQQTYKNFRILVRDDGSSDSTLTIINNFIQQHPNKITLIQNREQNLGPIQNFSRLIAASSASYLLLSDQDDFWLPEKIDILLSRIQKVEKEYSADLPVLVHSNLKVVDQNLAPIHQSFWKYIGINPARDALNNLLVQNVITGCAAIFNRPLAKICTPIPQQALMHDWWIGLIASSLGKISKIDQPTVLYRQHPSNTLGAKQFIWSRSYFADKIKLMLEPAETYFLADYISQADKFYSQHKHSLSKEIQHSLQAFINIQQKGFFEKRLIAIHEGFTKAKLVQTIGLLLRL